MIAHARTPAAETPDAERYLALLHEVLIEARAQVFQSNPQFSALLRIAERVPGLLVHRGDSDREILAALEAFEQRYLGGQHHYSRILREGLSDEWQMHWDW